MEGGVEGAAPASAPAAALDVRRGVDALAGEWDALADAVGAPPFLRPGWFAAWYRAFTHGRPVVLSVPGGPLAAVGAFEHARGVLRSAANWHTPEWDIGAAGPDDARRLADGVFARRPRRVELRFLDEAGRAYPAFRAAAEAAGYRLLVRTLERSPYIELEGDPQSRLARKVAKELDRSARRLERAEGPVSLEAVDGTVGLDDLLQEGFRLEGSGWKLDRGTAIVSRPETHEFYTEVARWAAGRGALRLSFLRAGERRIAFDLLLVDERRAYVLKRGYDADYRAFSPGKLLARELVRVLAADGFASYELLGEAEPWKLEWTDRVRERLILQAFAPTAAGLADWAAYRAGRPAAKRALATVERLRRRRA